MYKEAIEVLKVAIRRDPDYAKSYYNLGLIYNLSNDKDSAVEQYKILKNLDSELADKLFRLINK
jgi:tetratricopeptide (TPR) repeat protein